MYRNVYYDSRNEAYKLFTWDKDGKRVVVDCSYNPYLYIESKTVSDATSLFNTDLKKKSFRNQFDRRKFVSRLPTDRVFENLSCDQQFLADMYWQISGDDDFNIHPLKTYFIDIETYSPDDFPHPDKAKDAINVITLYDTIEEEFLTWGTKELDTPIPNVKYMYCSTEYEMLTRFVEHIKTSPPDILSGWNSQFFDIPYIIMRIAKVLGDNYYHDLSPVGNVYSRQQTGKFGNDQTRWYISGISSLDYLDVYQKFSPGVKESYKLDAIAELELGDRKVDYGSSNLSELADNDWQKFVEYNVQDVNLLVKMDDKLRYLELLRMLAYTGMTTLEGAMGTLGVVTGAAVIAARKQNLVMPTFVKSNFDTGKNPGAYVGEPQNGFQESIISFDANSLYPNVMISMNLSPETKVGNIVHRDETSIHLRHVSGKIYKLTPDQFSRFIAAKKIAVTKADVLFSQSKQGIIPQIVDDLYSVRVKHRTALDKAKRVLSKMSVDDSNYSTVKRDVDQLNIKQYTIKILINSIYGYFGNKMAPFGDDDIASSITLTGQAVIKSSNKILRDYIYKLTGKSKDDSDPIIYNDTDSSYVSIQMIMDSISSPFSVDGQVTAAAYAEAEKLESHLNVEIIKWGASELNSTDCRFVFKRECMSDVGIFLQKKRYVLRLLDDEGIKCNRFKYTGVEVVRSTMPKAIKPHVKRIIETMLDTKSLALTNDVFMNTYSIFKNLQIEDIAFVMGIRDYDKYAKRCNEYAVGKGTPIHVKASYYYNLLIKKLKLSSKFEYITSGDKVRYYYVSTPNKLGITSLAYKQYLPDKLREDFSPNTEMMFEKIVFSIIDRFYDAVNWKLQKPSRQAQTDLFELLSFD
jgi:DNA polymerase elongation subunit (family B)